jgi:serine/threonine protein kinase
VRRFRIARPPWASIWAIALYVLVGVGLAGVVVLWRTRALQRHAALLEEKVAVRTRQLDEKNAELTRANEDLVESQKHADRIFSALAEVLEGKVLDDRYRLEEQIGRGGFGAVFRATDLTDGSSVAVKVFRPQSGNDSTDAIARFRQEAESGAQVNHKNAVAVLGTGVSSDGILYLVMQLLEGRSLKAELGRLGKLPPPRAVGIAVQMLDALAEAHRRGIIHRDIKPENVFLHHEGNDEIVKVVDFGVAKVKDPASKERSLTLSGAVVGTPVYMAPERLEDRAYDGRSDVYSVGVLLYEMLVGSPPFDSKDGNLWSLILMHVKEPPKPPRDLEPAVPSQLSDVVLAALAKDPANRPTAERLAEMLAETVLPPGATVSQRATV